MNEAPFPETFPPSVSVSPSDTTTAYLTKDHEKPAQAGRYVLHDRLGQGGMGVVWRAFDPEIKRTLAVKAMPSSGAEGEARFLEEARITGRLQHPAIPPVFEMGRLDDGRPYFAMKLIQGRTLAELLRERLSPAHEQPRFIAIVLQLCQAIAFAHSRHVIHRDLKPANIMVGAFGEVQVMDWGLAKQLRSGAVENHAEDITATSFSETAQTIAGTIVGTPTYMPPEQARGEIDRLDERSDVFGLGAILCEVLTGSPPFVGANFQAVMTQAQRGDLSEALRRLTNCGAEEDLVLLTQACLSSEREHRPATAQVVVERIEVYQVTVQERLRQAEIARAQADIERREERKRRRLWMGLAAALVLIFVVGGLGVWIHQQKQQETAIREERVTQQSGALMQRAAELRDRYLWDESKKVLDQLDELLQSEGNDGDRTNAEEARRHWETAKELDNLRQKLHINLHYENRNEEARKTFQSVMSKVGWDVTEGDPAEWGKRLRNSPIREHVSGAIDFWAARETDPPRRVQLWRVLATAGEAWRVEVVEALEKYDLDRIEAATKALSDRERTPQAIHALSQVLIKRPQIALELLQDGCRRHRDDFWLRFRTGLTLHYGPLLSVCGSCPALRGCGCPSP